MESSIWTCAAHRTGLKLEAAALTHLVTSSVDSPGKGCQGVIIQRTAPPPLNWDNQKQFTNQTSHKILHLLLVPSPTWWHHSTCVHTVFPGLFFLPKIGISGCRLKLPLKTRTDPSLTLWRRIRVNRYPTSLDSREKPLLCFGKTRSTLTGKRFF